MSQTPNDWKFSNVQGKFLNPGQIQFSFSQMGRANQCHPKKSVLLTPHGDEDIDIGRSTGES
jgi:hypothetical protein